VVVVKTREGEVHSPGAQGRTRDSSADSGPGASQSLVQSFRKLCTKPPTATTEDDFPPHAGTADHAATSAVHAITSPHCRGAQRQIAAQVPASPVERHCRASDEQGRSGGGGGRVVKAGAAALDAQEYAPPRANFCAP